MLKFRNVYDVHVITNTYMLLSLITNTYIFSLTPALFYGQ